MSYSTRNDWQRQLDDAAIAGCKHYVPIALRGTHDHVYRPLGNLIEERAKIDEGSAKQAEAHLRQFCITVGNHDLGAASRQPGYVLGINGMKRELGLDDTFTDEDAKALEMVARAALNEMRDPTKRAIRQARIGR